MSGRRFWSRWKGKGFIGATGFIGGGTDVHGREIRRPPWKSYLELCSRTPVWTNTDDSKKGWETGGRTKREGQRTREIREAGRPESSSGAQEPAGVK